MPFFPTTGKNEITFQWRRAVPPGETAPLKTANAPARLMPKPIPEDALRCILQISLESPLLEDNLASFLRWLSSLHHGTRKLGLYRDTVKEAPPLAAALVSLQHNESTIFCFCIVRTIETGVGWEKSLEGRKHER